MNEPQKRRSGGQALCRALAVASCLGLPLQARAGADAGIRSVFADGAGNRALALGGAFASVADDASAPLWNPGGLGFVARRSLGASYASLYGLGFQEQYASFVLPSWRFGTVGFTYQQFGVDGIDRRDERNFVLSEGESDSQSQVTFSYGRALGDLWSLGAAFKLRRHSLAGFSDTGFGADVGVLFKPALVLGQRQAWAERLGCGFVVQNVLQPTLRLNQASVEEPPSARAGLSYWLPWAPAHLLWMADLEKTDGMDVRAHAGMEARVHSALSLRLGVDAGKLTMGTGIAWRDLSFDYVYQSNDIEAVHRFGAAFRFGLSVAASRQATLAAEEAALAARLSEEFRKRQEIQVQTLLQEAAVAHGQNELDTALDLLGTVRVLAPEEPRARALEATYLGDKARRFEAASEYANAALLYGQVLALAPGDTSATAGLSRCQSLSDLRAARTQQIRLEFARAMEAFSAEDFASARLGFGLVLELNPGDEEASGMLARTETAIARRTANQLQLAERLVTDGVLDEATRLAEQVRALDPQTPGLETLQARLRLARRSEAQARQARSQPTPADSQTTHSARAAAPLTLERRQEVEDLYRRGVAAIQQGREADAVRYWELVWSFDPNYERVREHLKREYMTRGLELFAQGSLDEAIQQWQKALQVDPTDSRAMAYLQRAQEQLSRTRQILGHGE